MKKITALILAVLGIILVLSGLGLITLTQQFLLYLGIPLLVLALIFFAR